MCLTSRSLISRLVPYFWVKILISNSNFIKPLSCIGVITNDCNPHKEGPTLRLSSSELGTCQGQNSFTNFFFFFFLILGVVLRLKANKANARCIKNRETRLHQGEAGPLGHKTPPRNFLLPTFLNMCGLTWTAHKPKLGQGRHLGKTNYEIKARQGIDGFLWAFEVAWPVSAHS